MKDIIFEKYGDYEPQIKCLDKGFVKLVDCMPRVLREGEDTADYAIVEAARQSYERETKTVADDKTLIRYLMRHTHTSPLEMIEFKLHCKLPIFVAREMIRHRTANVNEMSGRYSEMPEEYYIPGELRVQSLMNTQGSDGLLSDAQTQSDKGLMRLQSQNAFKFYNRLLEQGVAREQARIVLPLSTYTKWYWKIDLHNLLHFLNLRCDEHAQQEIRVYADAILELIKPIVPWTISAWEDYSPYRGGMILTRFEVEAIRNSICQTPTEAGISAPNIRSDNKLEQKEWKIKAKKLGFGV